MKHLTFSHDKAYQGDVLIKKCSIPKGAEVFEQKDKALAYGEATGHAHVITGGSVEFLRFESKRYLRVLEEAKIEHLKDFKIWSKEHYPFILPKGEYEIGITKEYDYEKEEARRVAD